MYWSVHDEFISHEVTWVISEKLDFTNKKEDDEEDEKQKQINRVSKAIMSSDLRPSVQFIYV